MENKIKVKELYYKIDLIKQYLRAHLLMDGVEGVVISKMFEKDITNVSDNYIDINFEDILITYDVNKKKVCDTFEIYNKDGNFMGYMNIYDYLKVEIE